MQRDNKVIHRNISERELKEFLKNEFSRLVVSSSFVVLSILLLAIVYFGYYFISFIPVGLFFLFLRSRTIMVMSEVVVKFRFYYLVSSFLFALFIMLGNIWVGFLLLSVVIALMFFMYFSSVWKQLQKEHGVREDEWYRNE